MKTMKLIIGIVTLSCTLLLPHISSVYLHLNSPTAMLIICLFIAAGVISLCTRKSKRIISDLLPAIFYFSLGLIFINLVQYSVPLHKITIVWLAVIMFVLCFTFIFFIADKYIKNNYFHQDIDVEKKPNICAYCNTKTFDVICPKCGTSTFLPIDRVLINNGFVISKLFDGLYSCIFIDDVNNKWCVFDKTQKINKGIYPYKSIIKVELYTDNTPYSSHCNLCKSMSVIVSIDNLYQPAIVIDVIKQPLYTNSPKYKNSLSFARDVISTFNYMMNKAKH